MYFMFIYLHLCVCIKVFFLFSFIQLNIFVFHFFCCTILLFEICSIVECASAVIRCVYILIAHSFSVNFISFHQLYTAIHIYGLLVGVDVARPHIEKSTNDSYIRMKERGRRQPKISEHFRI